MALYQHHEVVPMDIDATDDNISLKMATASPDQLQKLCLEYVARNLTKFCCEYVSLEGDHTEPKLCLKSSEIKLHRDLAEQLLRTLSEARQLKDYTLSLFANQNLVSIRKACLRYATLTSRGLRALSGHQLTELDAAGVRNVNVNDIIGALGEWTRRNLRSLNVSNCTFMNNSKFCIVISLPQLRLLRHLNVSYTEFGNNLGLEWVAEGLTHLESLDISGTLVYNIAPLTRLKQLKSLSMFHTRVAEKDIPSTVAQLPELRHLDISQDMHPVPDSAHETGVNVLLNADDSVPNLISLDISGRDNIRDEALWHFVSRRPRLKFLGLTQTQGVVKDRQSTIEMCYEAYLSDERHVNFRPELKVSGYATESQVLEGLQRYTERPHYVHKLLCFLFNMTQFLEKPRPDIVKIILPQMRAHPRILGVQMAASACLYNLTKHQLGEGVHVSVLSTMVGLVLDAMETFYSQQQLQKNVLLTLCSDRILQDVNFDRYRASKMVMDCLFVFDDPSMTRMSVAICSILAAKISTVQTTLLGTKRNMQKLLQIVRQKADIRSVDITLKFTLSALWNLTDESPPTCTIFDNEGGLDLFIDILEIFPDESTLQTKVLGLINNIAEVKTLRDNLKREDFLKHCKRLLENDQIEVSYFAAGIVAHLLKDGEDTWASKPHLREEFQQSLHNSILKWKNPAGEMVAYRSFSPFFPLLKCYEIPEVQLWSVWAMQHVCTKNASRYCPMLVTQGGVDLLSEMVAQPHLHPDVHRVATGVLEVVRQNRIAVASPCEIKKK
ncbi:protein zyg-11 homolog B-like isoform X1 [Lytechinus pictus]|uniref:protein zyg-11 homolog B-like isoform X1 n=2 Tax=Lytechinus pictus TaxID=7653 RepID=UPI0030BA05C7